MPIVIHTYLTKYTFQPNPFGFADWLRGTLVLYEKSKKYGYTLEIDYSHPILQLFKNKHDKKCTYVNEILLPIDFDLQNTMIDKLFLSGKNFNISTHILPKDFYQTDSSQDTKEYMKQFLTFNDSITEKINKFKGDYIVIHLRTGDEYLVYEQQNKDYLELYTRAKNIIQKQTLPIILIGDNKIMRDSLVKELNIIQTMSFPSHSGLSISNLEDVLIDFGIMSKAKKNILCNQNRFWI